MQTLQKEGRFWSLFSSFWECHKALLLSWKRTDCALYFMKSSIRLYFFAMKRWATHWMNGREKASIINPMTERIASTMSVLSMKTMRQL